MGWTPTTTTTNEYDADGRLIRQVSVSETEWDDDETNMMLALAEYEDGLNELGIPFEDALNENSQWGFEHLRDFSRIALDRKRKELEAEFPETAHEITLVPYLIEP